MDGLTERFSPAQLQQYALQAQLTQQQPAESKDGGKWARLAGLVGSNLFDAETTRQALQRPGTKEGNPMMAGITKHPAALYAVKGGMGLLEWLLTNKLAKKNKTAANVVAGGISALNAGVGLSNMSKGR